MPSQRISIKDVAISIGNNVIGGCEEVSFTIARDNEEAYEAGNYFPVEIVDGKFHITGSISRAFIDVDLLNTITPNQALWPSFTITGEIVSGKTPGRTIWITGAKFDSHDVNSLGLDGYAKNALPFKALSWKYAK
jgi:hypothetical protein